VNRFLRLNSDSVLLRCNIIFIKFDDFFTLTVESVP